MKPKTPIVCLKMLLLACAAGLLASPSTTWARGEEFVPRAGELYAIRVPGYDNGAQVTLPQGKEIAARYRWIYVNASEKTISEARQEATMLADAVGNRPMVLVYMPRHTSDGQRNEYSRNLMDSIQALVEQALADNREVLVSAKSYGVHQALHAIKKFQSPLILLTGISPAFGAFGHALSENVLNYIDEVERTKSRYCMIASEGDVFPWNAGGASYWRGPQILGDPRVRQAMDRNRANVYCVLLQGPGHGMDHYLDHGLTGALKKCAEHFHMVDTPLGDVVAGRKPVEETARSGDSPSWLVPLLFLPTQ